MQMKKLFVFLLGLLMSTALWAQQKTISGTVSDASGPLPGANVVVKGTTTGIVTTPDGKFVLDVPQNATTLVVSFIGYVPQEVDIAGKTTVDVILQPDAIGIEEVVAIGYGTVKKSDLTGAVGAVKGEAIAERQTTMLSQALQGATAGLMVTRNNSAPGSTATIRIRYYNHWRQ